MLSQSQVLKFVKIPLIAWPTILLLTVCTLVHVTVDFLLSQGLIKPHAAFSVNVMASFAAFTPMHDASHGSVAKHNLKIVNDVVGYWAAFFFPVPFPAFKHLHLTHHKHTNGPEDPDLWAGQGPWYLLPLRWMSIELHYYITYFSKISTRPGMELVLFFLSFAIFIAFGVLLHLNGLVTVVVFGWFLPGRIAIMCLSITFDYLPHRPHNVTAKQDPYLATSVTSLHGEHTWMLTWLLLHQNYHNVHHLAPFVPFYLYSTMWYAFKDQLMDKGTKIKPILGLNPSGSDSLRGKKA